MLGGHPAEVTLTENYAMLPTSAVSGFYFGHRDSQYFGVARIGEDQLADYAERRGVDIETGDALASAQSRLSTVIASAAKQSSARLPNWMPRARSSQYGCVMLRSCSLLLLARAGSSPRAQQRITPELVAEGPAPSRRRGRAGDPHAHQAGLARLLAEPGRCRAADGRGMAVARRRESSGRCAIRSRRGSTSPG